MITENLSTLRIHKLTQKQYAKMLATNSFEENSLYLTPEEPLGYTEYNIILPEINLVFAEDDIDDGILIEEKPNLQIGKTYLVNWDGAEYECICYPGERDFRCLGNDSYTSSVIEDRYDGEPFLFIVSDYLNTNVITSDVGSHVVSILGEVVHQIDKKYLPDTGTLPTVTNENNGAFLRVVEGQWTAVVIPNAEEASF